MKKMFFIIFAVSIALCFVSCSTTTITDKPGSYAYGLNEEINIIDIDSRASLGTVKVTGFEIIADEPFVIKEYQETTSDGERIYKDVTYSRMVQVYYVYNCIDSSHSVSGANFTSLGDTVKASESNFTGKPKPREGQHSFLVALKNSDNSLGLNFNYNSLQTKPTAVIRFDLT